MMRQAARRAAGGFTDEFLHWCSWCSIADLHTCVRARMFVCCIPCSVFALVIAGAWTASVSVHMLRNASLVIEQDLTQTGRWFAARALHRTLVIVGRP
jgi:hypothetical protein